MPICTLLPHLPPRCFATQISGCPTHTGKTKLYWIIVLWKHGMVCLGGVQASSGPEYSPPRSGTWEWAPGKDWLPPCHHEQVLPPQNTRFSVTPSTGQRGQRESSTILMAAPNLIPVALKKVTQTLVGWKMWLDKQGSLDAWRKLAAWKRSIKVNGQSKSELTPEETETTQMAKRTQRKRKTLISTLRAGFRLHGPVTWAGTHGPTLRRAPSLF